MLYLIHFTLVTSVYPDTEGKTDQIRLVEAQSQYEAKAKLVTHYEARDESYCISHQVHIHQCSETIV